MEQKFMRPGSLVQIWNSDFLLCLFFLLFLLRMNSGWVYFKNSAARSSLAVS